jgi:hypothetical protein
LWQYIAHVEDDDGKASGLKQQICRFQCLLQTRPRFVRNLLPALRLHAEPEQPFQNDVRRSR